MFFGVYLSFFSRPDAYLQQYILSVVRILPYIIPITNYFHSYISLVQLLKNLSLLSE